MSWFAPPRPGDWVVLTDTVKTTLTDHLVGGDAGIRRGTRGVVLRTLGWGALEVRLDAGIVGGVTARVPASRVRVVRRGGGTDAFAARTSRINAVRAGVGLALVGPFAYFALCWFLHGGSRGGLVAAIVDGLLQGALDFLGFGLAHPLSALVYVLVLTVASRFAFGR